MYTKCYLRDRKRVQSFHQVIETRVEEFGRTRNAVGTRAIGEHFHTFFEFSQTFVGVILQLNRNTENMFSISFRKRRDGEKGNNSFKPTLIIKM